MKRTIPWFPAKRYGWGWGLPSTWQGWLVLLAYVASLIVASRVFPPPGQLVAFLACTFASSAVLIAICWWKGEAPAWRRGDGGST